MSHRYAANARENWGMKREGAAGFGVEGEAVLLKTPGEIKDPVNDTEGNEMLEVGKMLIREAIQFERNGLEREDREMMVGLLEPVLEKMDRVIENRGDDKERSRKSRSQVASEPPVGSSSSSRGYHDDRRYRDPGAGPSSSSGYHDDRRYRDPGAGPSSSIGYHDDRRYREQAAGPSHGFNDDRRYNDRSPNTNSGYR